MKRDMDLILEIAFEIEKASEIVVTDGHEIESFSREQIMYHVDLMAQAGRYEM